MKFSIVLLCRNERNFIVNCINSILNFDLPDCASIELLVVDGMSDDGTRELVKSIIDRDDRVKIIDNPKQLQVYAFNLGFLHATGDWVAILGAHATYPANYLELCWETAQRTQADNVGGIAITESRGENYEAMLVQALTTHRFGVGNSGFRTGAAEGWADTVLGGFYKRDVIERIGWFDERLTRNQDYEFNRRLIASGGKIWLNPQIQWHYFNQSSLTKFYKKQILWEAPYNAYMWYLAPHSFTPRHAVTGLFAIGIIVGAILAPFSRWVAVLYLGIVSLYGLLAIISAIQQAFRYNQPFHVLSLPLCFFLYHFTHGLGVVQGLFRLVLRIAPVQSMPEPWSGAGQKRAFPLSQPIKL